MRKIFLGYIFLLSILSAEINEYMSDVYFANGINTDGKKADKALKDIKSSFEISHPDSFKAVNDWKVSINRTQGLGIDLYEAMLQKIEEEWTIKYTFKFISALDYTYGGIVKRAAKGVLKEDIEKFAKEQASNIAREIFIEFVHVEGLTREALEFIFNKVFQKLVDEVVTQTILQPEEEIKKREQEDVKKQFEAYTKSIKDGHGVVVIAHSQGNLFTNVVYDMFTNHWIPWDEDTAWMKKYFSTFALGSPANSVLGKKEPFVTFHEDIVGLTSLGLGTNISHPNPMICGKIGDIRIPWCFKAHYFLTSYMKEKVTRDHILGFIRNRVDEQTYNKMLRPSQWKPKNLGCSCKTKYAEMTHIYDPEGMKSYMENEKVKDFAEGSAGKIYRADAGDHSEYVRAMDGDRSMDGVFTIEEIEEEGACYVLKDDVSNELGKIEGESEEVIPQEGIITVDLTWEDSEINMNLEVDMPFGEQDIKDVECPLEHYYVATEEDVKPGTYPVYMRANTADINESNIPQKIDLVIHTPGEAMTFDFNITSIDMLNIGHVANIIIEEDKKVHFVSTSSPEVVTHYGGGGGNSSSYTKYLYEIVSKLKQALMGPLSNAGMELTEAKGFESNTPLYIGATSGGESLLTSGLLHFPSDVLNTLDNEKFYVVSIVGGNDIDANDDGKVDNNITTSEGTIHAIIRGERLKNENFKINILTEAVYQLTKDMLTDELNTTTMTKKIDYISKKLLNSDVDKNNVINYDDVLWWVPLNDKDKLRKKYNTDYQPIAEKIYADEEIYEDAVALIDIENKMTISENAGIETIVGFINIDFDDNVTVHSLQGEGSENFSMNQDGVLTLAENNVLDYETKRGYRLSVIISDGYGNDFFEKIYISIGNVIESVPVLRDFLDVDIYEDATIGTVLTSIRAMGKNSDENTIDSFSIVRGNAENLFEIDEKGTITLTSLLNVTPQNDYWLEVVATNVVGASVPMHLTINKSENTGSEITLNVEENTTQGTVIGTINLENGVERITLSGIGAEWFSIDKNGTIRLNKVLDKQIQTSYRLDVIVIRDQKQSTPIRLTINIINIIDDEPVLNAAIFSVQENMAVGTIVGTVEVNSTGTSAISSMTLYGTGQYDFSIDINGTVRVNSLINYEYHTMYHLYAYATNDKADSAIVDVIINVGNVIEIVPSLHDFKGYIEENATTGSIIGTVGLETSGDSPISAFTLEGEGNTNFTVDTNGTIRVSDTAQLDEVVQKTYSLNVYAENLAGVSALKDAIIVLTYDEDIPVEPFDFQVVDSQINSLTLSWENGSDTIQGFNLVVNGGSPIVLDKNISTYEVTGLFPDTTYTFTLKALNDRGESQGVAVEGTTAHDPSAVERFREVLVAKCGPYPNSYDSFYTKFNSDIGVYNGTIYCRNAGLNDTDLLTFKVLKGVSGYLYLESNNLTNLDALIDLVSLGGSFSLGNNPNLIDISGVSNISGYNGQSLSIDVDQYTTKADKNSTFCNTTWDLSGVDDMSQVCEGFGTYIPSEVDKLKESLLAVCYIRADEFYANFDIENGIYDDDLDCAYYGATNDDLLGFKFLQEVTGYLDLTDNQFTDLDGLSNLTTVGEDLYINDNNLVNFNGLSSLTTIGGDFEFENNDINSVEGLNSLATVGGDIYFEYYNLTNVDGLSSLTTVGGDFSLYSNDLVNVHGLSNLATVGGNFYIDYNKLINLDGLNSLISVEGYFDIGDNSDLEDIDGLSNLTTLGDGLDIGFTKLNNVNGLGSLTTVEGDIYLSDNNLTSLHGLLNLTYIGGAFEVASNQLSSLDGLNNLNTIGGSFDISKNALTNLDSIVNLTDLGGSFYMENNPLLMNISGASNIEGIAGNRLSIDLEQYGIKADNTKSFCATSWDIYNDSTDIVDDMSVVCQP